MWNIKRNDKTFYQQNVGLKYGNSVCSTSISLEGHRFHFKYVITASNFTTGKAWNRPIVLDHPSRQSQSIKLLIPTSHQASFHYDLENFVRTDSKCVQMDKRSNNFVTVEGIRGRAWTGRVVWNFGAVQKFPRPELLDGRTLK